tara:strand:- start:1592 stop:1828 length:237 start_codon:yes stop_codon:yes gene_type:complete
VSKRILWLKSLDITGLKSCVTVLLTVMRTNVLVLLCFIAGIFAIVAISDDFGSNGGQNPIFSLVLAFLSALQGKPAKY